MYLYFAPSLHTLFFNKKEVISLKLDSDQKNEFLYKIDFYVGIGPAWLEQLGGAINNLF